MDMLEEAKRVVVSIEEGMSFGLAQARATVAISLALIAIAEELEKINKRESFRAKGLSK